MMAKRIFITATNTDIGKTYTTQKLIETFSARGLKVGAIKPVETGVEEVTHDGEKLMASLKHCNPSLKYLEIKDIVPITYKLPAAPFIASEGEKIEYDKIDKALENMERICDVVLIEGAGGLYVPIDENMMMIDLIRRYEATTLLVTHCSLGCINDTILSSLALENANIPHVTAFNCRQNDSGFAAISEPYFLKKGQKVLKVDRDIDSICDLLYNL